MDDHNFNEYTCGDETCPNYQKPFRDFVQHYACEKCRNIDPAAFRYFAGRGVSDTTEFSDTVDHKIIRAPGANKDP